MYTSHWFVATKVMRQKPWNMQMWITPVHKKLAFWDASTCVGMLKRPEVVLAHLEGARVLLYCILHFFLPNRILLMHVLYVWDTHTHTTVCLRTTPLWRCGYVDGDIIAVHMYHAFVLTCVVSWHHMCVCNTIPILRVRTRGCLCIIQYLATVSLSLFLSGLLPAQCCCQSTGSQMGSLILLGPMPNQHSPH